VQRIEEDVQGGIIFFAECGNVGGVQVGRRFQFPELAVPYAGDVGRMNDGITMLQAVGGACFFQPVLQLVAGAELVCIETEAGMPQLLKALLYQVDRICIPGVSDAKDHVQKIKNKQQPLGHCLLMINECCLNYSSHHSSSPSEGYFCV